MTDVSTHLVKGLTSVSTVSHEAPQTLTSITTWSVDLEVGKPARAGGVKKSDDEEIKGPEGVRASDGHRTARSGMGTHAESPHTANPRCVAKSGLFRSPG